MKWLKFLLGSVIFVDLNKADLIPGCLKYIDGRCWTCYQRRPEQLSRGCGARLPDSDPCAFYDSDTKYQVIKCDICKPGFKLVFDEINASKRKCVKGTYQHCTNEVQIAGNTDVCLGCDNQMYFSVDANKCITPAAGKPRIKNCLWGGYYNAGDPRCERCKPGYTLEYLNTCKRDTIEGCLTASVSGRCLSCDVYEGYSMQPDGSCLKVIEQ